MPSHRPSGLPAHAWNWGPGKWEWSGWPGMASVQALTSPVRPGLSPPERGRTQLPPAPAWGGASLALSEP